jgi:hypothetical protein
MYEEAFLEMLRTERELTERVVFKMASQQLGEAWVGLDDRRQHGAMRGPDRRAA